MHSTYYVYECSEHGPFEIPLPFGSEVPWWSLCPYMKEHDHKQCTEAPCKYACMRSSPRVLTPPSSVIVEGGTGARKSR